MTDIADIDDIDTKNYWPTPIDTKNLNHA